MSVKCPKCSSDQISGGTRGFGAGKAAAGLVVAGPVGLAAGAIGKNKAMNSCMACGHQWSPEKIAKKKEAQAAKESLGPGGEFFSGLIVVLAGLAGWVAFSYLGFVAAIIAAVVTFFTGIFLFAFLGV